MKKLGFIIAIVLIAAVALAACGSQPKAQGSSDDAPPPGTERVMAGNAAMPIYKFELPAGQTWGNYNKLTAEYLVDETQLKKPLRSGALRVYGNYTEKDLGGKGNVSLATDNMFAHKIIDQLTTKWEDLGAVADQWFTVEYNITGSRAHANYNRVNLPGAGDTGPFYFALGLTSQDAGSARISITYLVRNITLHHATDPSLNVVTTDPGIEDSNAAYYSNEVKRSGFAN